MGKLCPLRTADSPFSEQPINLAKSLALSCLRSICSLSAVENLVLTSVAMVFPPFFRLIAMCVFVWG